MGILGQVFFGEQEKGYALVTPHLLGPFYIPQTEAVVDQLRGVGERIEILPGIPRGGSLIDRADACGVVDL
jgi:hypothetical protein